MMVDKIIWLVELVTIDLLFDPFLLILEDEFIAILDGLFNPLVHFHFTLEPHQVRTSDFKFSVGDLGLHGGLPCHMHKIIV